MDRTIQRHGQLDAEGEGLDLIRQLANSAQKLASRRTILQRQIAKAKEIAKELGSYHHARAQDELQSVIIDFADKVNDRMRQLDQTLRDLLHFVSPIAN